MWNSSHSELPVQFKPERGCVFTQIDCKAGGDAAPMRAYQTATFGYIFNSFADGEHVYRNNNEGRTFKAMSASDDPQIAARVRLFRYRPVEEFFDLASDPDCLVNLVDDPRYQKHVEEYRQRVGAQTREMEDPLVSAFELRNDPNKMEDVMWEASKPWRGKELILIHISKKPTPTPPRRGPESAASGVL